MTPGVESLDVIGLISGGKDSFFSLLHCLANRHRVVALANLYPPATSLPSNELEDLNSFMYQTAGHAVIPLYSDALGLPLYRQEILGSALNQSKNYGAAPKDTASGDLGGMVVKGSGDETEDLLPLLQKVMAAHPTANAVCTGAIFSTYQRTRIESIAKRLNLVSLSYLWQYPSLPTPSPGGLLDDLAAADFDVRIVKVASGGLDEGLLWGNLMDATIRGRVQKAVDRFGGSILGEGGEYETLVTNGPRPFWKGRIEVRLEDMWIGKGSGGEAWIEFRKGSGVIVGNEDNKTEDGAGWNERIGRPGIWDIEFEALDSATTEFDRRYTTISADRAWEAKIVVCKHQSSLILSNIAAPSDTATTGEQMLAINSILMGILLEYNISAADGIAFTTILLHTMADFASVNDVYGRLFTKPNPPARVTIACGSTLPPGVGVMASFIICLDTASREGLHVQSRSYWAPENIGPYSQAVSMPLQSNNLGARVVHVAGQIPLVPASMEILRKNEGYHEAQGTDMELFQRQTCLALQHLWRIGKVMNVSWWMDATAFIAGEHNICEKATVAWKTWKAVHQVETWDCHSDEENDDGVGGLDVWDLKYGGLGSLDPGPSKSRSLPDFNRLSNPTCHNAPYFFAVEVDELPRGSDIEWQSSGLAYQDDSASTVQHAFRYISIPWESCAADTDLRASVMGKLDGRQGAGASSARIYTPRPDLVNDFSMQVIPCRSVWGPAAQQLRAGIVIQNKTETQTVH